MMRLRQRGPDRVFDRTGDVASPSWRDRLADTGDLLRQLSRPGGPQRVLDLPRGDGHPVLVIPGLFGSDYMLRHFRAQLGDIGYRPEGWGAGLHLVPTPAAWRTVEQRLIAVSEQSGHKVSLVGHSLGGVLSRALAYEHPERIRRVITVCSPFSLPTASPIAPLYSMLRHRCDVEFLLARLAEPPPVPTTAIYSPRDGVVAWSSCIDPPSRGRDCVAIDGAHTTMLSHPDAIRVIAERLARRPGSRATVARR
ncbi:MAG: alpha/beta fold hydrolase [Alphaproteobacteria bacterium]|nr:alpha/beta fold hydrolase [Alphaproteobacteria bacterium]